VVLGSLPEGIPAIVLFVPLLFPIARSLGIEEVHYAMLVILAMGLGLFMPPFGVGYYAACKIGQVDPNAGLRKIWLCDTHTLLNSMKDLGSIDQEAESVADR
jgi:TRAP-type C4-dicarboxylate transport system permease large subunit